MKSAVNGEEFTFNPILDFLHLFDRMVEPFDSTFGVLALILIPYIIALIIQIFPLTIFGVILIIYFFGVFWINESTDGMLLYGERRGWWYAGLTKTPGFDEYMIKVNKEIEERKKANEIKEQLTEGRY